MHRRVTCGRIFYRGKEHSAVYYGGKERFEIGELREDGEPIRVYLDPEKRDPGVSSANYEALRDGYSNADYPLKYTGFSRDDCGVYRWRVDEDWFEFLYSGVCTIYIRGDGIVKFSDGSSQLVKTKVIHDADGTDYVSMESTAVYCPASADRGIFVGTLSPLGMARYRMGIDDETALAVNTCGGVLDFSFSGVIAVEVGNVSVQGKVDAAENPHADERYQSRMTFVNHGDGRPGAVRLATTSGGTTYRVERTRITYRNTTTKATDALYNLASVMNLRLLFAYTGITEVPMQLLKKLANLREADSEQEEDMNDALGEKYGYTMGFTHYYTGTMEGAFLKCEQLASLPVGVFATLRPMDCGNVFAYCTGLTRLPTGLFDWFYDQMQIQYAAGVGEGAGLCFNNPHAQLRNAFKGCSNLRGSTPTITLQDGSKKKIWEIFGVGKAQGASLCKTVDVRRWKASTGDIVPVPCYWCNGCFEGCTGLDDYDEIPDWWKLPVGKAVLWTPLTSDSGETIRVFDISSAEGNPYSLPDWH